MIPSIIAADQYDDRSLIESIIDSYFFIDYGFIKDVNGDGTVNVTHAKLLKARTGDNMKATLTTNVEVLTISTKGLALKVPYEKGDKVLLLALKDFVKSTKDVSQAEENKFLIHYDRETMKALPLCLFSSDAKVVVEAKDGAMAIACSSFKVTDANGIAALEVNP